ncbi:hypothetical protein CC80DRAFT_488595 [Byssothecium circinans]|uniref:Uncharacterized protein n=1 Tax=Byssothecium circinans TaxID=147558 RepID=A0A6A5U811_9PLEO|nr:hypothetical protein CC80DRAFT_488595 [Byssothecium circinans]
MNPVGEEGSMFGNLFDKVPPKRLEVKRIWQELFCILRVMHRLILGNSVNLCVDGGRVLLANRQEYAILKDLVMGMYCVVHSGEP